MSTRMTPEEDGPYGKAARAYLKAGWPESLPIWKGGSRDKQPMVRGYHGREGIWPDKTTAQMWASRYRLANVALRLPKWVIGLDVDQYDDKCGADTLDELQADIGELPTTYMSTSRGRDGADPDAMSGIRLFAVPADYDDVAWPSQAGPDIEVITWYERYAICWPSLHRTGKVYQWYLDGVPVRYLPSPEDLAVLPVDWCEYLVSLANRGGSHAGATFDVSAASSARQWMENYGGGDECAYIAEIGPRWLAAMSNGSAHEAAKLAVAQAVKAAAEGHTGINSALWPVRESFIARVGARGAGQRRRGEGKATSEWRAMVAGAIKQWGGDVAESDSVCYDLAEADLDGRNG